MLKIHERELPGAPEPVTNADLDAGPAFQNKIIDFEVAKKALSRTGRSRSVFSEVSSRLPDLAAEDWFDWTALGALLLAVALFPMLAILLFR
jgi:hypothetical protein